MPRDKKAAEAAPEDDSLSFEEALRRLEEVVGNLERGDQPLEKALALFEEGIRLSRALTARLEKAQARIDLLVASRGGAPALEHFPVDEE